MATRAEYLDRFRRIRHKRIIKRAGKALIFDEEAMIRALADKKVPTMMQHCVIRVKPKMSGKDKEQYLSAFNICAAVFQKNGYMRKNSFTMTSKGQKNNSRHQREKEAGAKRSKFNSMTNRLWKTSIDMYKKERKERSKISGQ